MTKEFWIAIGLAIVAVCAIGALLVYVGDWRMKCYEAHAERSSAELILMCK